MSLFGSCVLDTFISQHLFDLDEVVIMKSKIRNEYLNIVLLRSTHVPRKSQSETIADKEMKPHKQKNHLRINVLNGLS